MNKLTILLTTEGTYPYNTGGVSTWCHRLVGEMKEIDFSIISVIDNPYAKPKFVLPDNVKRFIPLPLWRTIDSSEHLNWLPFSDIFGCKKQTTDVVIEKLFIPVFDRVIDEILCTSKNPYVFGANLTEMYKFFKIYDYEKTMKSKFVYLYFKKKIIKGLHREDYFYSENTKCPTIREIEESLGLIYRFFNILNITIPRTEITHSSAAGFCGIPNVLAKIMRGTPYLLTEHGVYMREQYLWTNRADMKIFVKNCLLSFVESVVRLNYSYADLISPVCSYNTRWEKKYGVCDEKIKVIYNGVDSKIFSPQKKENKKGKIIAVARIDPLKDIKNFIYAAKIILDKLPTIRFEIYGGISDSQYYKECLILRNSLGLKNRIVFLGHTENVEKAYHEGDIVILPSISEAFPYSVVETMMIGKPVVATDVGGVKEAVGSYGVVVPPRNPEAIAEACISLMNDEEARNRMGLQARERASSIFSIEKFLNEYKEAYTFLRNGGFNYERKQSNRFEYPGV